MRVSDLELPEGVGDWIAHQLRTLGINEEAAYRPLPIGKQFHASVLIATEPALIHVHGDAQGSGRGQIQLSLRSHLGPMCWDSDSPQRGRLPIRRKHDGV
jgi:hypothetical protein